MNLQFHRAVAHAAEMRALSNKGAHSFRCKGYFRGLPFLDLCLDPQFLHRKPVCDIRTRELQDDWLALADSDFSGFKGIALCNNLDALHSRLRRSRRRAGTDKCKEEQ